MKIKCLCTLSDGNVLNTGTVEIPDELSGQKTYHFISNLSDGNFVDCSFTVPDHELPFYKGYHFRVTLSDGRVLDTESFGIPYVPDVYDNMYHAGYVDADGNAILPIEDDSLQYSFDNGECTLLHMPPMTGDVILDWITVRGDLYYLTTIGKNPWATQTSDLLTLTFGDHVTRFEDSTNTTNANTCKFNSGLKIYFGDNITYMGTYAIGAVGLLSNYTHIELHFNSWDSFWRSAGSMGHIVFTAYYAHRIGFYLYIGDERVSMIELPPDSTVLPSFAFATMHNNFIIPEGTTELGTTLFRYGITALHIASTVLEKFYSTTVYVASGYTCSVYTVMSEEEWTSRFGDSKITNANYQIMHYDWDGVL